MAPTANADARIPHVIAEIGVKGDFPAAGAAIQRLRESVGREHGTALDIARLILQDPGLSSKVLRLVNSAFYRQRGNPVSTITRAVILLGFGAIRDLTTGLVLIEEFARRGRSRQFVRESVRRALLTGLVAQALAVKVGLPTPEEAYLLGLFANLGQLWLATFYPEEFEQACTLAREQRLPLDRAVAQVFGTGPGPLAAAILEHWNFPATFTDYFRHPHPRDRMATTGSREKLVAVVDLAAEYAAGAPEDGSPAPAVLERFHSLFGLAWEHFHAAARAASEALREQAPLLGLAPSPSARARTGGPAARAATTAARPRLPADAAPALEIVAEIARSMLDADDPDHTLSMVLEGIGRVGRFDLVLLALLDPGENALVVRLAYGERVEEGLRVLVVPCGAGSGLLAETLLGRAPRLVAEGTAALLVPAGAPAPPLPAGAYVTHPLVTRGRGAGVVLAARTRGPVGPDDLPMLDLFCNQATLALERAGR